MPCRVTFHFNLDRSWFNSLHQRPVTEPFYQQLKFFQLYSSSVTEHRPDRVSKWIIPMRFYLGLVLENPETEWRTIIRSHRKRRTGQFEGQTLTSQINEATWLLKVKVKCIICLLFICFNFFYAWLQLTSERKVLKVKYGSVRPCCYML